MSERLYDAIIIGGGPSGLTSGLYLARAKYKVLVIEKDAFGGQITITDEIVNFPGVKKTSGKELTETMRKQAESFGCEFLLAEVTGLEVEGDIKKVHTSRGTLEAFAIILATGASPRLAGFEGEKEFRGKGIAYCATCDGEFFTNKEVFVVGGGFAAAEEAIFLTKYASKVTIMIRGDDFSCAQSVAEKARSTPKIEVMTNVGITKVEGDESGLHKLHYQNRKTGETHLYESEDNFGVFVFAGYSPASGLVKDLGIVSKEGYIITDANMATTIPGLYASGDIRIKPLRQVATAVGDGALAATEAEKYCAMMEEKTGLRPSSTFKKAEVAEEEKGAPVHEGSPFSPEMVAQLSPVFARMSRPLILELSLDGGTLSKELEAYIDGLAALTDKLSVKKDGSHHDAPCVRVLDKDGHYLGLAFHGVPGGHEFTSFVIGLYNASGPGQMIAPEDESSAKGINRPIDMKILVSLSCTMCPDLVSACQKIASISDQVTAEVYDVTRFPALQKEYNVMSVPCLVINDGEKVSFGKKNVTEVLSLINSL